MTIANIGTARDEILGAFRTAWEAGAPSAGLPVLFWDVAQQVPTAGAWARVTVRHLSGEQATLSGENGNRRFRHRGVVTAQVFTPTGDGMVLSDQLAAIVKTAFEGVTTVGGVIFRNVRFTEVGQDGVWFQQNVLADFEYDEVR